jgi:ABC-type Fe3+-siderophore transport system permease subunit
MIQIRKPELEALIRERMISGAFLTVEDVLLQALKSSPLASETLLGKKSEALSRTGAELVAAMQDSSFKDIVLVCESHRMPVREVVF